MASREDTVKLVHRAINASIFERVQELLRRICTESDFALDFVSGDILATESDVYKSDSSAEEDESGRGSESDSENNEGEKDEGHDVKPAEDIEDEPARKRKWTNYVHMCYPTCEQCNGEFDVTDNSRDSESVCRWHDGGSKVDWHADTWDDWDAQIGGPQDTPENREEHTDGFK